MISNNDFFVIKRLPRILKNVVGYNRKDKRYWRKNDEKILEDVRNNYSTKDKKEDERFKTEFDKLSKRLNELLFENIMR